MKLSSATRTFLLHSKSTTLPKKTSHLHSIQEYLPILKWDTPAITELKLLAIVETLCEYKCILLGHLITIYTDHKNLTFSKFTTDHVTSWELIVEEYSPNIV